MEPCQDEDWFSAIEREAALKTKKQSTPRNSNSNNVDSECQPTATTNHNHYNHYNHCNTSPSADNYFAAQSNLVDNKASNTQPNAQNATLQSRFLPTLSITNLNLNLSAVAVPSVSQVSQAITSFSARSSPTRAGLPRNNSNDYSEEAQFHPKHEFPNTTSLAANTSSSGRQSPNRPYYDTINPPAPSKMASAYPSHSSILSSTTQAVVSSLSFFTSSSSTPAPMNSHADYRTPTSSTRPKIATAYPGQNSLLNTTLNSTKAVVTKLASAVSSASARTAGADKPTTPHGYGYADVRGGMRDSSSTLYERVGTSSSSWSKANDSWGGFADEQESVGVSVGMYGGSMPVKRGSIGTGGMDTTGRNTSQ